MSPSEHYVAAESLLKAATEARYRSESKSIERMLLEAQVHATLALLPARPTTPEEAPR